MNHKVNNVQQLHMSAKELYDNILNSLDITQNPFDSTNKQLKSKKCPKCKRYRIGNYRIVYYINTKKGFVEFIDVDDRTGIYRKY